MADGDEENKRDKKFRWPQGPPKFHNQPNVNPSSKNRKFNIPGSAIGNNTFHQNRTRNPRQLHLQFAPPIHFSENREILQKRATPGFGYKKLLDLSQTSSEKLLTIFNIENNNLNAFLKSESKPDSIVLFVRCLFKLTETEFDAAKLNLFTLVCKSPFMEVLRKYILDLQYADKSDKENNKLFWNDKESFFNNVMRFSEAVITLTPETAAVTLRKLFDAVKISSNETHLTFSEELLKMFKEVLHKFATCVAEKNLKMVKLGSAVGAEDNNLPPNDFRDIQIMPSKEDLFSKPQFLRPNIVNGAYKSAEHYLDVQFRLVREDFIAPLRDALREYGLSKDKRMHGGARFYRNARLLNYKLIQGVLAVEVCYNENIYKRRQKQIQVANSKRFMYGSLLCLTCDNFGTMIFCTVHDNDDVGLGKIAVEITGQQITDDMFNKEYLLVESETYFLPYLHVLKALQNPSLAINFPFEDYIVNVKSGETSPKYLENFKEYSLFDGSEISLDDESTWPSAAALGLDEAQYTAYKMALTREFVTIQGPPGTGKTFIGLKIVETLLINGYLDKIERLGKFGCRPILVVCYTNHALDQFLEGLLRVTQRVVRIGGQSKNKNLSEYNLSALRRSRNDDTIYNNNRLRNKFKNSSLEIESYQAVLQSLQIRSHIFDVTEKEIRFELNKNLVIIRRFNLPFDLKTFLYNFRGRVRPALVNWLLLTDYQDNPKRRNTFKNVSRQVDCDYLEDEHEEGALGEGEKYSDPRRPDVHANFSSEYVFITHPLEFSLKKFKKKLIQAEQFTHGSFRNIDEKNKCIAQYANLQYEVQHLKWRLLRGDNGYRKFEFKSDVSAESYTPEDRWSLYWKCVAILEKNVNNSFGPAIKKFQDQKAEYDELMQALDLHILEDALVVGVTTSGAARLQSQLRSLRSPVVIVEEAAEVMESHVVVSLTKHCEHLIMIGDHKQLRPTTATYQMAKQFNLDISLFERMVNNGSHCYQLAVQHRMRPEIARLITPAIYPILLNNANVESYPSVMGVVKNLYFIDHTEPEMYLEDTASRVNEHEAQFLLNLAKYLIQQGYSPDEITILATYSGQMFYLRNKRSSLPILENVSISVLDSFQGEENRIILLSLVRSNPEGNIGFLATDNRVCVALSRAREGFYIIGNMGILKSNSPLWDSINNTLTELDSIGPDLMLRCQIHPDMQTPVKAANDFSGVPEGGCWLICASLLPCGHHCTDLCHPGDRSHELFSCKAECERINCVLEHKCPLMCSEECLPCNQPVKRVLGCGHEIELKCHIDYLNYKCLIIVDVEMMPLCHHRGTKLCHDDLENAQCDEPCMDRLACGHACQRKCHKNRDPEHLDYKCNMSCARLNKGCTENHMCEKICSEECSPCTIKMLKSKRCTHNSIVECQQNVNDIPCMEKCKRSLKCGHFCKKLCKDLCCEKDCLVKVFKKRSCGHTVKIGCGADPNQLQCEQRCLRTSPCGHPCRQLCYQTCTQSACGTLVPNPYESLCKHVFEIPCWETSYDAELGPVMTMQYCKEPCGAVLLGCKHTCKGTCGTCVGGRLHENCKEPCGHVLVCGHSCNEPCREACPPCKRKCEVRCQHSRCPLKCGVPCPRCKHPCQRRCSHGKCTKYCGDECNLAQCSEACDKTLACGHACRGLCGVPCPPTCKTCKPEEFPELCFGTEEEEDARFIKLTDCPHVVEVTSMDKWVQQRPDGKISVPSCPYCKTPIVGTQRYSDGVKRAQSNIRKAKKKLFGDKKENVIKFIELGKRVIQLENKKEAQIRKVGVWKTLTTSLQKEVSKSMQLLNKRRQVFTLSVLDVNKLQFTFDILKTLQETYEKFCATDSDVAELHAKIILKAVKESGSNIVEQLSHDLNNEISRLKRIVDVTNLERSAATHQEQIKNEIKDIKARIISTLQPFDEGINEAIFKELNAMRKKLTMQPITDDERVMIVRVMGFKQGHWYMCPNGHPYCIADCGGAAVTSTCPDCKSVIGGTGHRLASGNRVATMMDYARHGAWSDAANMQNYDFMNNM